jgi:hypothetical protein
VASVLRGFHLQSGVDALYRSLLRTHSFKELSREYVDSFVNRKLNQGQRAAAPASVAAPALLTANPSAEASPPGGAESLFWRRLFVQLYITDLRMWLSRRENRHRERIRRWRAGMHDNTRDDLFPVITLGAANSISDVMFITRRHYVGYLSYVAAPLLYLLAVYRQQPPPAFAWRLALLLTVLAAALRQWTYEAYYDEQRLEPKGERSVAAVRCGAWCLIAIATIHLSRVLLAARRRSTAAAAVAAANAIALTASGGGSSSLRASAWSEDMPIRARELARNLVDVPTIAGR